MRRRPPVQVLLVVLGLAGALAGGWLVARWCLGVVVIGESGLLVCLGLFRDDGTRRADGVLRPGEHTLAEVLEHARQAR